MGPTFATLTGPWDRLDEKFIIMEDSISHTSIARYFWSSATLARVAGK